MKAEHRKQLQTNVLADRMGRLVSTLKQKPQKRTVFYIVLGLAAVLAVVLYLRYRSTQKYERSQLWVWLDNGHKLYIDELRQKSTTANAGKAARFQYAWFATWENGIKALAADQGRALDNLERVCKQMYEELREECKDDPIWEPEAMYCLAVIEETLAVRSRKHLEKARDLYEEVAEKFKTSAAGQRAEKRAALLKANSPSYNEIASFYQDLQKDLQIPETRPKRD